MHGSMDRPGLPRGRRGSVGLLLALLVLALAVVAAGCGGGSSSSGSGSAETGGSSGAEEKPAEGETAEGTETTSSGSGGFMAEAEKELAALYKGKFEDPPTSAPPHKKGVNLWIISCGEASQGCAEPVAESKKAGEKLGWKVTTFDGKFGEGDAYNNGIRQAIAGGAEAIIIFGINCNQAKTGYQEAKAAGVPLIGSHSFDCEDPHINEGSDLLAAEVPYSKFFEDNQEAEEAKGRAKADWIIVHTHGEAKVVNSEFTGFPGGEYENEAFEATMKKCTTCEILTTVKYGPAETANGVLKQAWASALAQYPEANAGVAEGDGIVTTAGMAQAVQSAGRTKTFALISSEGYAPNVELIREENGENAVTPIDQSWSAWGAVDTAIRVLAGQKPVLQGTGIQVVDKEHNLPEKGQPYHPPVEFEKLYEEAWGVR